MLSFLVSFGYTQTPTATVQGTITDPTGAIVPECSVEVRDLHTNSTRKTTTQGNGFFEIPLLPPGSYSLSVKKEGFKSYEINPLELRVDQKADLPITLEAGQISEVVNVTGATPLLESVTSSIGQVLDNQKIVDLPLSNRNILQLDQLVPGVHDFGATAAPATSGGVGFGRFNANGAPTNSNEFMLDGATAVVANLNAASLIPTIDALQESKIQTSNIPAEFGRTSAIVFNATYKSGTNRLHGTIYEFIRNTFLNANTWVNNANKQPRAFSNINTFGFSLGGPVWIPKVFDGRNRLFFFTNYEGYRDVTPVSMLLTVPTVAQKNGDFSNTRDANGNLITVYDPLTTAPVGSTYTRTQFPGNRIPSSRFNASGVALLSYYPDPNVTPANALSNSSNYLSRTSAYNTQNEWSVKIDYSPNEKNKFFGRYTQSFQGGGAANLFGSIPSCSTCAVGGNPAGPYSPRGGGAALFVIPKNTVLGYTRVISSTTLLDLRLAFNRQLITRIPQSAGFDLTALGMPAALAGAVFYKQFPAVTVSGFQGLGTPAATDLLTRGDNTLATVASLTLIRGKHSIKVGGDYRFFRYNESSGSNLTPSFTFSQTWTQQNPNTANVLQGSSIASMLLGATASGTATIPATIALQWFYGAIYLQDDWQVSQKLTLNLGVRYDAETSYTDRFDRATYFDPTATSVATAVDARAIGGLRFVGKDVSSRRRFPVDINNVSPRIGLAYKVDDKTVFRAAYGMLYQPILTYGFGAANYGTQGYSQDTSMVISNDGNLTPANYVSNPFPNGLTQPTGNSLGTNTFLGQSVTTQLRYGVRTPYYQQFSAGIQRQFGGSTLAEVGYVGGHGVHEYTNFSLNQLTPQNYAIGAALNQLQPNPFYGTITTGTLSAQRVALGQLLRPFPQFTDVIDNYASIGSITYSSLQAKVEHRLSHGLSVLAAYTWGKNMGNVGERYAAPISYQNAYNLGLERSYSPLDIAHTFTAAATYILPIGRGQTFGGGMSRWTDVLVGGWQLNSIVAFSGGQPLAITSNTNTLGFGAQASRPNRDYSQSLELNGRTPAKFFNTAAFTAPPQFVYGASKPFDGNLRGTGTNNVSASVFKNFPFREILNAQFRAEFYNVFNHSLWASPGTSFGTASFGVSANKVNNRTGQLSLKLIF